MKFGLQLGYWMAQPPVSAGELVMAAEEAWFDAVFAAESGADRVEHVLNSMGELELYKRKLREGTFRPS